jgi:hypothetical protein
MKEAEWVEPSYFPRKPRRSIVSISMKKEITVKGTLFAAKWDKNGDVVQLVIDTTEQDEYLIENNKTGKELQKYLRRDMELKGHLKEGCRGDFILVVDSYHVLENAGGKQAA